MLIPIFLFLFGAILGTFVNWAICQLCYFNVRSISPLSPPAPGVGPRHWSRFMPILGWLFARSEETIFGRGFWIRPFLIELVLAGFTVWFYDWQVKGGLTGFAPPAGQGELWFATHLLLITLLTAATFIDFDEQTIPDSITIPGTLAGLGFAVIFPDYRLPETSMNILVGPTFSPVTFLSPESLQESLPNAWFSNWRGLATGIGILVLWCVALMPKIATLRLGWRRAVPMMWASLIRPRRRRPCAIRVADRKPFGYVKMLAGLSLILSLGFTVVWFQNGNVYHSLLSAVLGLGFGGGLVWAVRLIASSAMGQEAMGFGDVTLMAMIGSFLGWQASLLVFVFAPFAALVIAAVQFVVSRERAIAFGPYLSLAALIVIVGWNRLWNDWAARGIFASIPLLLGVIGVSLVLLGVMMFALRITKGSEEQDA